MCPLPSSRAASCKVPLLPGAPQLPPALHRAQSPWTRPADDSTFTASPPRLSKACGELVTAPTKPPAQAGMAPSSCRRGDGKRQLRGGDEPSAGSHCLLVATEARWQRQSWDPLPASAGCTRAASHPRAGLAPWGTGQGTAGCL